jgi:hypothetical protein
VSEISVHATETYPRSFTGTISEPNAVAEVISLIEGLPAINPNAHYYCPKSVIGGLQLELQFLRAGQAEPVAIAFGAPRGCDQLQLDVGKTQDTPRSEARLVIRLVERLVGKKLEGAELQRVHPARVVWGTGGQAIRLAESIERVRLAAGRFFRGLAGLDCSSAWPVASGNTAGIL